MSDTTRSAFPTWARYTLVAVLSWAIGAIMLGGLVTIQTAASEAAPPAATTQATTGLVDGTYIVGTDIAPGRYSMTGARAMAYMDQKDGSTYVRQEVGHKGKRVVVDIADIPGSVVEFTGWSDITPLD